MGAGASTALENAVAPKRMSKIRAKQKRKQKLAKASVEAETSAQTIMKKYGRSGLKSDCRGRLVFGRTNGPNVNQCRL